MRRRSMAALLIVLGLLAVALPVQAGGWVSVTLDAPLGQVRPGEPQHIGFMVKQHGVTPIHTFDSKPLQTLLTARHKESGQTLRAEGYPDGAAGHFSVDVTFPAEGTWLMQITPAPFPPVALEPITVGAASVSSGAAAPNPATARATNDSDLPVTAAPAERAPADSESSSTLVLVLALAVIAGAGGTILALSMRSGGLGRIVRRSRTAE